MREREEKDDNVAKLTTNISKWAVDREGERENSYIFKPVVGNTKDGLAVAIHIFIEKFPNSRSPTPSDQ